MGKISIIHSGKRSAGYKRQNIAKIIDLHAEQTTYRAIAFSLKKLLDFKEA
jgi:hypothetical protein